MESDRWFARLQGHQSDLEALAELLQSGSINVSRREDDGYWYVWGSVFAGLEDSSAVRKRGLEVVETLNGVGALYGIQKVSARDVVEVTKAGVRKNTIAVAELITARSRVRAVAVVSGPDGKPKENENARAFRQILQLARTDERVWDALHFLAQQQNWSNLYKVFEIIGDDVGEQVHDLADRKKLGAFKATAQSRKLLGDEARHASEKCPEPHNPISLEEARQLIRQLVGNWLRKHRGTGS
jgi:hypothetical protein